MTSQKTTPNLSFSVFKLSAGLLCGCGLLGGGRAESIDLSHEFLGSADVSFNESSVGLATTEGNPRINISFTGARTTVDYEPAEVDLLSVPRKRIEDRKALSGVIRWDLTELTNGIIGGGTYRGFSGIRSIWIDEYYRQLFESVPAYIDADPRGWNVLAGARWSYFPSSAYLQVIMAHQQDHVSPGYEPQIFAPLLRGRDRLTSNSIRVSTENILTPRIRTRLELSTTQTTGRETRYSIQGSCNWAAAENYTLRAVLASVAEDPEFDAFSAAVTLERDWDSTWFAGLSVRTYFDSGEVVDPLIPSTAASPLRTIHTSISLRRQGIRSAVKLDAGFYQTDHAALPTPSQHFARLYRDRDWMHIQLSWEWRI